MKERQFQNAMVFQVQAGNGEMVVQSVVSDFGGSGPNQIPESQDGHQYQEQCGLARTLPHAFG
jgi:hypothetical protein